MGSAPWPDARVDGNTHCGAPQRPSLASRRRSGRATSCRMTGSSGGSPVLVCAAGRPHRSSFHRPQRSPMTSPRCLAEVLLLRSGSPSGASRTPPGGAAHPGWGIVPEQSSRPGRGPAVPGRAGALPRWDAVAAPDGDATVLWGAADVSGAVVDQEHLGPGGLNACGEADEPVVPTSGRHGADWVTTCAARSAARAG